MKNLIQNSSKELDYTNATEVTIESGEIVHLGNGEIAVAQGEIKAGEKGVVIRSDIIFNAPKLGTGALERGAKPGLGTAGNTVALDTTALTTINNAFVVESASSDATSVVLGLR